MRYAEPEKLSAERAPRDDRGLPDLHFGFYDRIVVFDNVTKLAHLLRLVQVGAGDDAGDLYDAARADLDEFAVQADKEPASTRWSYAHDWGGVRLIVVDSRCSRLLTADRRGMLDDEEFAWLDEQCQGGMDHLLIASSLPYLLPRTIHHAESWNEAVAGGAWGKAAATLGEKIRQGADLEHWAAFRNSFDDLVELLTEVADAERLGLGWCFISERFNIKEASTLSGAVGAVSSDIQIATAATNHNTRHPLVTAEVGQGGGDRVGGFTSTAASEWGKRTCWPHCGTLRRGAKLLVPSWSTRILSGL